MSRIQRTAPPGTGGGGGGAVESVNGKTGTVILGAADVGAISTAPESVTTSEIKAQAVTEPKLATAIIERLLLTGGTTGQALVKKSNTNYDVEWATVSGGGPLTFVAVEALNAELENEPTGFAPVKSATGTDGISHLTGAVKAKKLIAQNTLLFTLPAGQRPTFKKQLLLALTSTSATAPRMQFELKTNGEVVNTGGTLEAAVTVSFDDVTWAHEH